MRPAETERTGSLRLFLDQIPGFLHRSCRLPKFTYSPSGYQAEPPRVYHPSLVNFHHPPPAPPKPHAFGRRTHADHRLRLILHPRDRKIDSSQPQQMFLPLRLRSRRILNFSSCCQKPRLFEPRDGRQIRRDAVCGRSQGALAGPPTNPPIFES